MPGGQQMLENGDEIHHLDQEVVYATSSSMNPKVLQRNYGEMSNEMIEVIAADELMAEAVEEVGEMAEGRPYMYEYDSMVHTQHDQNIIYQLYQPLETSDGTFVCRICLELGETVEFANKPAYTHHRYKIHGSYNGDHKLPIEMHYQTFANVPEFERMFNRKPYNLPDHKVAPWLLGEEFSLGDEDAELDVVFDEQDDEVAEQPNEVQFGADVPRHQVGDKVYLRNFDLVPGRGNSLPYLYGYISEVDEHSPRFPYRVHFSKSKEPWPNETSVSAWVNPYDVLPITHGLIVIPDEDRISAASLLLCSCGGGEYGTPCSLFRSYLCSNGMAKACCLKSGKICEYHEEYADGDDTYGRLEALSKSFTGNQPRSKTRKRIPHLTPANAPLPNEQGNVDSMPVLTSENTAPRAKRKRIEQESVDTLPEVLTIVVENKDRTLVPAISKKCTGGDTQKKETEGISGRADEPAASTSRVNLLPSKGLKVDDLEERHPVEPPLFAEEKPLSLEKRQEDALKPHVRRSERSSKAKVFEDYVPIP
ncbi:hypothetical protein OESDEN_04604 [Oesophagostomum dentatum]|uniref:Uncharacterized protein n=1 Tax=Oesophagostomum dentatum TaxID=61180 RepID=A0A0B1THY5_OESDE|nr:hypothetical protein OESDEN_04604 [Oesophagostomum dentatum]